MCKEDFRGCRNPPKNGSNQANEKYYKAVLKQESIFLCCWPSVAFVDW